MNPFSATVDPQEPVTCGLDFSGREDAGTVQGCRIHAQITASGETFHMLERQESGSAIASYDALAAEAQQIRQAFVDGYVNRRIDHRDGEATAQQIDVWISIAGNSWDEMYPGLAQIALGSTTSTKGETQS